jgi:hypothetical protein
MVAVVQYTYRQNTQNDTKKQYIEQHKILEKGGPCPVLGELYPGICLTTEEKARKSSVTAKNYDYIISDHRDFYVLS